MQCKVVNCNSLVYYSIYCKKHIHNDKDETLEKFLNNRQLILLKRISGKDLGIATIASKIFLITTNDIILYIKHVGYRSIMEPMFNKLVNSYKDSMTIHINIYLDEFKNVSNTFVYTTFKLFSEYYSDNLSIKNLIVNMSGKKGMLSDNFDIRNKCTIDLIDKGGKNYIESTFFNMMELKYDPDNKVETSALFIQNLHNIETYLNSAEMISTMYLFNSFLKSSNVPDEYKIDGTETMSMIKICLELGLPVINKDVVNDVIGSTKCIALNDKCNNTTNTGKYCSAHEYLIHDKSAADYFSYLFHDLSASLSIYKFISMTSAGYFMEKTYYSIINSFRTSINSYHMTTLSAALKEQNISLVETDSITKNYYPNFGYIYTSLGNMIHIGVTINAKFISNGLIAIIAIPSVALSYYIVNGRESKVYLNMRSSNGFPIIPDILNVITITHAITGFENTIPQELSKFYRDFNVLPYDRSIDSCNIVSSKTNIGKTGRKVLRERLCMEINNLTQKSSPDERYCELITGAVLSFNSALTLPYSKGSVANYMNIHDIKDV